MNEYNEYVNAVNKIYDYLAKMKAGWNNLDNFNYINNIDEYRQTVIQNADIFKTKPPKERLEALGND